MALSDTKLRNLKPADKGYQGADVVSPPSIRSSAIWPNWAGSWAEKVMVNLGPKVSGLATHGCWTAFMRFRWSVSGRD